MNWFEKLFSTAVWGNNMSTDRKWIKWKHRILSDKHCLECLMLDGCWFLRAKTPRWPHHDFCHCTLDEISYHDVWSTASSSCSFSKFDPYLFNTNGNYAHAKEKLFNSWGYSVEDAEWLQNEFQNQWLQKYIEGDYKLGLLDIYGQRISIKIELPKRSGTGTVSFITGWIVKPNGQIQLTTPYGGK